MAPRRHAPAARSALALCACVLALSCRRSPSITLRVAVTSDLAPAFEALGGEFERTSDVELAYTFGASDALADRMQQGAASTHDVLVTPDVGQVGRLITLGRCDDLSRSFVGFATLVAITAPRAPRLESVQAIAGAAYPRVVVVQPERSPFGRAAMQVFSSLGIANALTPRLSYVDNAREAVARVRSGRADAAIVPRVAVTEGDSLAVPPDLYRPIEQVGVMCARDPSRRDAAMRFLQYVREGAGKPLLESWGFSFP